MITLIILIAALIFTFLQYKFEIIPTKEEDQPPLFAFISICLITFIFIYSIIIFAFRYEYNMKLNSYINYVEKYQEIKESGKIKYIENAALSQEYLNWDDKIEKIKYKNNGILDIFISDKKLKEGLEARKEITTD